MDRLADERDTYRRKNAYYYAEIDRLAKFFIPEGASVLEIGCSTGDLLAALKPSRGVGLDISPRTVEIARQKHPHLHFQVGTAEDLTLDEKFDYVVMSDVVGHLDDVWAAFRQLRKVMEPRSRLFLSYFSYAWNPILWLGARLGRKMPVVQQNWLGSGDLRNLLELNQLEGVHESTATILPAKVPVVSAIANRLLARVPGFHALSLVQFLVARPIWQRAAPPKKLSASVIVPCRNERGNVADIFARTPELGSGTELIFVDGNSDDGTVEEIERHLPTRPGAKLIHQG
ncbi:MAG: methyltransferase domain-containing protein, partial [Chloroflexota bacterium]